ncbi:NAD-dependent epimerase/dehydratase family protein [Streptomyces sp. NPDC057107]|uniref:NAD-dependent epimerase/dehydratase family protein n=1 Tax=Streptomyces sp. NPDC057107 TaxID=3346021 RepID=UPI00362A0E12
MAGEKTEPLVVVLGAAGYLGSAVVAELARRPVRLRRVARPGRLREIPAAVWGDASSQASPWAADLSRPGAVARAVAGADVIVHLVAHIGEASAWRAAEHDPAAARVNVEPAHDLVAALRARRGGGPPPVVLFAGSASQVGRAGVIDGSEPDEPVTVYARQKLAAEQALLAASAEGVLRGVSLRLPTVYGAGPGPLGNGVVTAMARRAFAGEPLPVWSDGSVERDLLHVTDAARAFAVCAAPDRAGALAGRHWVVGTGRPVRVADLFTAVARSVAAHTGAPPVPVVSVDPPATATAADVRGTVVDASAFRTATGWRPRQSMPEALDELVAALARQRAV